MAKPLNNVAKEFTQQISDSYIKCSKVSMAKPPSNRRIFFFDNFLPQLSKVFLILYGVTLKYFNILFLISLIISSQLYLHF